MLLSTNIFRDIEPDLKKKNKLPYHINCSNQLIIEWESDFLNILPFVSWK